MNRFRRLRSTPIAPLAAILLGLTAIEAAAQSNLLFVETYNELLKQKKVVLGVDYRIEGRISSLAPNLLKLQQCPQIFRPARGTEFGSAPQNRRVVELFGQLKRQEGKRVFVVEKLHFRQDDNDRFHLKRSAARGDEPEDWYDLAEWAARRAEFYDDRQLRRRAVEANRRGIEIERRQLEKVDAAALRKLAKKASDLKLPAAISQEYLHEAHRMTWEQIRDKQQPEFQALLGGLTADLNGAKVRLPTPRPERERRYRENPLRTYREADERTRRKLHRLFFLEVRLAAILHEAEAAGLSGFEIADAIDRELPELHERAERERERELKSRLERIGQLTRAELLDLADRFRRRKREKQADAAVKKWLKSVEEQARKKGPDGLVQAADEYLDLLEDRQRAADLLKEAYRLNPESERIAEKLTRLDYRLRGGEWLSAQELEAQPLGPIERAIREGRVIAGMTAEQVRSTLGAATSITRVATAGQVSEFWIYGKTNTSRLTVQLIRRTPGAPLKAVRVSQVAAR